MLKYFLNVYSSVLISKAPIQRDFDAHAGRGVVVTTGVAFTINLVVRECTTAKWATAFCTHVLDLQHQPNFAVAGTSRTTSLHIHTIGGGDCCTLHLLSVHSTVCLPHYCTQYTRREFDCTELHTKFTVSKASPDALKGREFHLRKGYEL